MKTLIFGAGNLLLTDEGFGVHFIQYLQKHFRFPEEVVLYDGGTLGIMVTHNLEDAWTVGDHFLLLGKGKIAWKGTAAELRAKPKDTLDKFFRGEEI